ncbi:MAG: alpha/beta hydrolase [Hyphomonadaceae bacterium]|nr:alpha/beta hydrolase [Hyphomonadaceae bacterium]
MNVTRRDLRFLAAALGVSAFGDAFAQTGAPAGGASPAPSSDPLALVDPELRAGAAQVMQWPALTAENLLAARARNVLPQPLPPPAPTVNVRSIPGKRGDPDVGVEVIGVKSADRLRPAIVHMHGGGYIVARAANMTAFCQEVSADLDCVVVNVDYRLAPETPFPGSMEDNYAALKWLHRNAASLGVDRGKIAVMGESAGGGHAAILAIAARDRGEVPIRYQVLIYPMLDDRIGGARRVPPHIGALGWTETRNQFGWSSFLGMPAGSAAPPYGAVPARVEDLAGLPPAFIGVGAIDLFVDEDIEYARRLVNAGVATQVHVVPGAYHAFDFVAPQARVSREFTSAWKSALRAAFAG